MGMLSEIFRAIANLHGDTGFDQGVADVCNSIADWLDAHNIMPL